MLALPVRSISVFTSTLIILSPTVRNASRLFCTNGVALWPARTCFPRAQHRHPSRLRKTNLSKLARPIWLAGWLAGNSAVTLFRNKILRHDVLVKHIQHVICILIYHYNSIRGSSSRKTALHTDSPPISTLVQNSLKSFKGRLFAKRPF